MVVKPKVKDKPEQLEERFAQLLTQMETLVGDDGEFASFKDLVTAIQTDVAALKKTDPAKVLEELDRMKSGQATLARQIRNSRRGLYVSGIEDEDFSLLKAMCAVKSGDWSLAGKEKEMMDQWRSKASAQAIGDDARGGYFVADQVIADVIAAIYTKSVFINLAGEGTTRVSVLEGLSGANVKIPKFLGGLIAYWIGEEDNYIDSMTTVGDVNLNPKKLGVLVRITDSMRKFQSFGFENLLRNDMQRAAAKKLDWTIMYGTGGDNTPRGITHANGIKIYSAQSGGVGTLGTTPLNAAPFQADWQGGEMDFDDLDNMILALEEDEIDLDASAAIISSPRFIKRLKQLKILNFSGQTTGQPYLLGAPTLSDAKLRDALGMDIDSTTQIFSNNMPGESINAPTTSTEEEFTDVFSGNLAEIILARWFGIEIEDDAGKGKGFVSDHIYMKLRMYADIGYRQERALIMSPDVRART